MEVRQRVYVPNHGNMSVLELSMEGSVNIGSLSLIFDGLGVDFIGDFVLVLFSGHNERIGSSVRAGTHK